MALKAGFPGCRLVCASCIGISARNAPEMNQVIHEFCERNGCKLNTVQETDNLFTSLTQVGMGIGFGILPDYEQDLLMRNVRSRPIEGHPGIELCVAWRSSNRSALLKAFLGVVWEMLSARQSR